MPKKLINHSDGPANEQKDKSISSQHISISNTANANQQNQQSFDVKSNPFLDDFEVCNEYKNEESFSPKSYNLEIKLPTDSSNPDHESKLIQFMIINEESDLSCLLPKFYAIKLQFQSEQNLFANISTHWPSILHIIQM